MGKPKLSNRLKARAVKSLARSYVRITGSVADAFMLWCLVTPTDDIARALERRVAGEPFVV